MKKFILLCSFGLLGTFVIASTELQSSSSYVIETSESIAFGPLCCTATVWYNGQPVQTYTVCNTPNNCAVAQAFAEAYVCANGGPCE